MGVVIISPDGERPWHETDIAGLRRAFLRGDLTALALTRVLIERIRRLDQAGPCVNSVIELNPDAEETAVRLDHERESGGDRGLLHGIPVLVKDNIGTGDKMQTTAGSLALIGGAAASDAEIIRRLRAAGAIVLGKTNLSEWANFRSLRAETGWSARGGLVRNPHVLDRSPAGSSSGSAAAVASGFVPVALGTETHASIVGPSHACGIVGIKPTVGLTSRSGVIPVAPSFDSVGVHARSVADAAVTLGTLTGPDSRDPATLIAAPFARRDYTPFLKGVDGLRGAKIGVARCWLGAHPDADRAFETALDVMRRAGAELVDPIEFPSWPHLRDDDSEFTVMLYEMKYALNEYLSERPGISVKSIADVVEFNLKHADKELRYFGQEIFERALSVGDLNHPRYRKAIARSRTLGAARGIDAVLNRYDLMAVVTPMGGPARTIDLINGRLPQFDGPTALTARAGYPFITVPAGDVLGLPIGIGFMGGAYSEPILIRLAHAFEQLTRARRMPTFLPSLV